MIRNIVFSQPLAVLNLEITGTDTSIDRIVEIRTLRLKPGGSFIHTTHRLNPERPIPPEALAVCGITDTDLTYEPRIMEFSARLSA